MPATTDSGPESEFKEPQRESPVSQSENRNPKSTIRNSPDRAIERVILGAIALYLGLTLAVSAYMALAAANAPLQRVFRLPPCAMRTYLGVPCPLCFGTTTYILVWRGHCLEALTLSPFVFALFCASAAAVPILGFLIVSRHPAGHWTGRIPRRTWRWGLAFLVLFFVVNWLYLIATQAGADPSAIRAQFP